MNTSILLWCLTWSNLRKSIILVGVTMSHTKSQHTQKATYCILSVKRAIFPWFCIFYVSVFYGVMVHVYAFLCIILCVSYRVLIVSLLPYRVVALFYAALTLQYMSCISLVTALWKVAFYATDYFWINFGLRNSDNHMKMIRQYNNLIEWEIKLHFSISKTLTQKINVL